MTDPSKPTPQEMIAELESWVPWPGNQRYSLLNKALRWALPLLRAMHENPSNPHVTSHIRVLEDFLPESAPTREASAQETNEAVRWALPVLRSYAIRKVTSPPTKNTPESNIHNLRLLATGESVAWDLVETALEWALPILETSMTETIIEKAIRLRMAVAPMLRGPAQEASMNSSRFSAEDRRQVAYFLATAAQFPNMARAEAKIYARAADMISEPATSPSPAQKSEALEEFSLKLLAKRDDPKCPESVLRSAMIDAAMVIRSAGITTEECARLEKFIEEKFPGELDGMPTVTVAIRLLSGHRANDSSDELEAHRILGGKPGESLLDVAKRVSDAAPSWPEDDRCQCCRFVMPMSLDADPPALRPWICGTCQKEGIQRKSGKSAVRLPTLDAAQIPVTRDLALEVLRGFLATMQRAYPYAPSPSPEQWATAREALIVALADDAAERQAQMDLDAIRAMMPPQGQESLVETVAMFSRYLTTVMAALGYWNPLPKIESIQSAIGANWIKRCRPGTMNATPERCNACTAPCGTVHLPIPEAPTVFLKEALEKADLFRSQREVAWKELREIREAIGANLEESTLDEVNRLMADRRTKDTAIRTLQMIHVAIGGTESEATLDAVNRVMQEKDMIGTCRREDCQRASSALCPDHETEHQMQTWIDSELANKDIAQSNIEFLNYAKREAKCTRTVLRKQLPRLAESIEWMLTEVFRASRGLRQFEGPMPKPKANNHGAFEAINDLRMSAELTAGNEKMPARSREDAAIRAEAFMMAGAMLGPIK